MSFFLLGKGSDDDLWLLSPNAFESRQAALGELSRLTAEPGFTHWDAEVFVMELDKGTPVLLVRPAEVAAVSEEPSTALELESIDIKVDAIPEPLEPVVAETPEPDEVPDETTRVGVAAHEVDERVAVDEPAEVDAFVAIDESVEDESIAVDELLIEADEVDVVELGIEAELPAHDTGDEAADDAALAAVIEDLHAEDDVVPAESDADESEVSGPAPDVVVAEPDADAVVVEADEVPLVETHEAPVVEPVDAVWAEGLDLMQEDATPSLRDALKRTAAHMESEGIVAPESVGPAEESVDAPATPAAEEPVDAPIVSSAEEPAAAWPWDTAAADSGFSLDAIEEPAREATPLVTAAGDDETVAASRPVILGTYAEAPSPGIPEVGFAIPLVDPAAFAEPMSAPTDAAEPPVEPVLPDAGTPVPEPAAEAPAAPDTSDFILDLEPVQTLPVQDSNMTCEDCVYVRTCPNRDQRDPKSCGSFQWK